MSSWACLNGWMDEWIDGCTCDVRWWNDALCHTHTHIHIHTLHSMPTRYSMDCMHTSL